ncbi:hypothetical protein HX773_24625 [Pantoea sp. B9002]|uniref:hypothetical protein n=1 Tax=Pantoea sp. B9002 TaxID=2726979 RepID=UPI0015A22C5B|nr:hypothetical protein [Pantoea sp. B9002]NWA64087.1 hypothetical protein [Pantoea sp. B9002]
MLVSVEAFSKMLGITPGEVVFCIRNNDKLHGLALPKPSYGKGNHNSPMFRMSDVITFVKSYNEKGASDGE